MTDEADVENDLQRRDIRTVTFGSVPLVLYAMAIDFRICFILQNEKSVSAFQASRRHEAAAVRARGDVAHRRRALPPLLLPDQGQARAGRPLPQGRTPNKGSLIARKIINSIVNHLYALYRAGFCWGFHLFCQPA